MSLGAPVAPSPDDIPRNLEALRAQDWAARRAAAFALAGDVGNDRVFVELQESLEDANSAVGEAAAEVLTRHGGRAGLHAVIKVLAANDDNLGYILEDVLIFLENDGFPVIDRLRELAVAEPPGAIRDCAEDMIERTRSFLGR